MLRKKRKKITLSITLLLSMQCTTIKPLIDFLYLAILMKKTVKRLQKRKLTKKERITVLSYFDVYSCKSLPWLLPRNTIFFYACKQNNSRLASGLLDFGNIKVNLREPRTAKTALTYAIEHKNRFLVKKLLKHGANTRDWLNKPLLVACKQNCTNIVKLLLAYEARVNRAEEYTLNTSLHIACEHKNKRMIQLLISYGADAYKENKYGQTPLSILQKSENPELITLLTGKNKKEYPVANPQTKEKKTAEKVAFKISANNKIEDQSRTMAPLRLPIIAEYSDSDSSEYSSSEYLGEKLLYQKYPCYSTSSKKPHSILPRNPSEDLIDVDIDIDAIDKDIEKIIRKYSPETE